MFNINKNKYTVADLIVVRNYIMNVKGFELSDAMIKYYDVNGDGKVTSTDYVIISNMLGLKTNDYKG